MHSRRAGNFHDIPHGEKLMIARIMIRGEVMYIENNVTTFQLVMGVGSWIHFMEDSR
jgi:hypothetical protein